MKPWVFLATMLIENLLVGGFALLYPRIVRKGLLFGVYVGEARSESEEAEAITRGWNRGIVALLAVCVLLGGILSFATPDPYAAVVPVHLQIVVFLGLYLRAYFRARALAPPGPPPPAVAPLSATPATSALLPALTLAVSVACGAFAVAYTWAHYSELPGTVPTHFGASGEPDAFRPKSVSSVMLLPVLVLVIGTFLGGMSWLTAHAKRVLRRSAEETSLAAQLRFRAAVTRFLCGISLVAVGMLTLISVVSVRVGLGLSLRLPPAVNVLGILVAVYAVGGAIYLALRYGQGGARLEKARADTPLTDGLADNRHWVLGMFYVNRDDPSFLVERRFGIGYTLNFGNWKAVTVVLGFVALVLVLTAVAALVS
ncbi:MAG: DUF1648 domain-containing protein [Acidobacteriia bacterium]|nr:DUF1648 domain-containing protein [Terriglobia bacterium]